MYLIVGLGNPGRRYRKTRHNVGFMLLDLLAEQWGGKFETFSAASLICRTESSGKEIVLAKPQTYMNRSGLAVKGLFSEFGVSPAESLIVYDEIALPLGKVRFRRSGSSGGHRGLQSVIDCIGSSDLPRLRIGIAGESPVDDLAGFVLKKFKFRERREVREVLESCRSSVEVFLAEGIDRAMALYN